ncbi:MAG: sigma-54 dependent transcriptional regulator [bacterium]
MHHILLVGDDFFIDELREALVSHGWEVDTVDEPNDASALLRGRSYECCVVCDGDERLRVRDVVTGFGVAPTVPVVAIVHDNDVSTAVDAMKLGASHALERNTTTTAVIAAIEAAVPKGSAPILGDPRDIFVRSEHSPLNRILDKLPQISLANAPVLISGESGTGKELVARTIHNMSERSSGPFVAVNCGAIPDTLLEGELFGWVKGAFTGAHQDRMGQFEAADGGTIFLDEIGEIPLHLQVKLLRVLQESEVVPVGSSRPRKLDFRVVAATNRHLMNEVAAGNFREDLYYRICVLPVHLPPLRERPQDVPIIAKYLMAMFNRLNSTHILGINPQAMMAMTAYSWPGNVRELENLMNRLAILKRVGMLELSDLPEQFNGATPPPPQIGLYVPSEGMDMAETMEQLESSLVRQALEKADGNKAQAARLLGLNRTTLVEKVKRLGLMDEH